MRWLIDAYRNDKQEVILWLKEGREDKRVKAHHEASFLIGHEAKNKLEERGIPYEEERRRDVYGHHRAVLRVRPTGGEPYERAIKRLEKSTRWRFSLYDADIPPEEAYLHEHDLRPCTAVEEHGEGYRHADDDPLPPLKQMLLEVHAEKGYVRDEQPITSITIGEDKHEGEEKDVLAAFAKRYQEENPDVIIMPYAYARLPHLERRLQLHGLRCDFHRWDHRPLRYLGGKAFYSYGSITYRDFGFSLRGRLLIDSTTVIGDTCDLDGLMELCQLTGAPLQKIARRSFGAAFQAALVRMMRQEDILIPYKDKPVDNPISMYDLAKADRYGHTYDAKVGLHQDVIEVDFSSMYPWIIHNRNISAETILTKKGEREQAPGIPVWIRTDRQGITPRCIKPIIDRRMHYKQHPSTINKARARALKWLLVTSYGYLRFREFKLGIASAHMSIGAYARDTLLRAASIAEDHGFEIVHGIVDSLYLKKKGVTEEEGRRLCNEISAATGIPASYEGKLKWAVFLPSTRDDETPVPTRYYGAFTNGDVKARGIEVRKRSSPALVKRFQRAVLALMSAEDDEEGIKNNTGAYAQELRAAIKSIKEEPAEGLAIKLKLGKTRYETNTPQKALTRKLQEQGVRVQPGQMIAYVHTTRGPVLLNEYEHGTADEEEYAKLLSRSLHSLLQPFGHTKETIAALAAPTRQTTIEEYLKARPLASLRARH